MTCTVFTRHPPSRSPWAACAFILLSACGPGDAETNENVGGGASSAGSGGGSSDADDSSPTGGDGGASAASASDLPERIARYLRDDTPRLAIEIDSVEGLEPYSQSQPYLQRLLEGLLDKSEGIWFEPDETLQPRGSDHEWTFEALDTFAREHARDDVDGSVSIHVLSVDGRYVKEGLEGTVLGLAWGNRYIALFQDAMRSRCNSGLVGSLNREICEVAERSVWAHELGHVLGLVDNGIPMVTDHRDPDHGRHEVREGCLMYWAYESAELFDTLIARLDSGDSELDFCQESRADVAQAKR